MAHQQQRYRVLEKIASGGMAEVFRAESAGLEGFKKIVAIKRVLPHLSEKKQFIGMFLDEARVSAQLSHSNCVQVFDIGVGDNTYFIVMEFVDGADLKAVIEHHKRLGRALPPEEACLIGVRICEGLAYAHELVDSKGDNLHIVHRDMSPPNVLITRYGEVKIVDFGLAKANSQLERSEPGIIKGKFSYLSPEAALGQPVDHRTDIFAVGIILWEMLAGRRLFMGQTDLETVRQVQAARVPPIRDINPQVSAELDQVVVRALAGDPRQRYQSARELGHDLNAQLFHARRAVSSFDIAKLVEPIRLERERERRRKADKASNIGSLIEEALFEFISIEETANESPASQQGSAPLNLGTFEDAQDWTRGLAHSSPAGPREQRGSPASRQFELGNLAALEEDSPSGRQRSAPPSFKSASPSASNLALSSSAPASIAPAAATAQAARSSSKGALIALVVFALILAGVAGAYFGGVIR